MSLKDKQTALEQSAQYCDEIVQSIVDSCCRDLDSYIDTISQHFRDVMNVDNITLDNFVLNLPLLIYYASSKLEYYGMRDDLSNLEKKKAIVHFLSTSESPIKAANMKQVMAEVASDEDTILSMVYGRAYKTIRNKLDVAYEILASCKKIMSRRIEEYKVEHSDTGRQQPQQQNRF